MGSRANVAIEFGKDAEGKPQRVYLYSHWDGEEIALSLRNAVKRGDRLDDPQYFARIVFDCMTDGHHGEETGYGISPMVCDNSYRILVADCDKGDVYADDMDRRIPFSEFGAMDDAAVLSLME